MNPPRTFSLHRTDNGELLNLIDSTGCPINELIFPSLNLEDASRALAANFKAFRFPSTPTVNFVATVQFCQDTCDPVTCTGQSSQHLNILIIETDTNVEV